tara:strand:- start:77 stop:505 length:429 start_codon:yes stop_codon:yes gene_type:complete
MDYEYHSKLFEENMNNDDVDNIDINNSDISNSDIHKNNRFKNEFQQLNNRLYTIEKNMNNIKDNIINTQVQLDLIIKILNGDVKDNCEKMKNHIDFVENVYDNVKNPLGYLCNKLNFFAKDDNYQLHDNDNNMLSYDISSNI